MFRVAAHSLNGRVGAGAWRSAAGGPATRLRGAEPCRAAPAGGGGRDSSRAGLRLSAPAAPTSGQLTVTPLPSSPSPPILSSTPPHPLNPPPPAPSPTPSSLAPPPPPWGGSCGGRRALVATAWRCTGRAPPGCGRGALGGRCRRLLPARTRPHTITEIQHYSSHRPPFFPHTSSPKPDGDRISRRRRRCRSRRRRRHLTWRLASGQRGDEPRGSVATSLGVAWRPASG